MIDTTPRILMKIPEIAEATGLSESHVWRLVWNGSLPSVRISRSVRVRKQDLDNFISDRLERPTAA